MAASVVWTVQMALTAEQMDDLRLASEERQQSYASLVTDALIQAGIIRSAERPWQKPRYSVAELALLNDTSISAAEVARRIGRSRHAIWIARKRRQS